MWWDWHEGVPSFKARKITQDKAASDKYGIEYIESVNNPMLSTDPDVIHQGSNSGYQAINLAYNHGATRIILLGYDMMLGNKAHWFGDHPNKVRSSYPAFIRFYSDMAPQAKQLGLEIINCTRKTALHCFERKSLDSAL